MDEATRRKLCRLIAGIVVVDDDLDDAEDAFLDGMLTKFGLTSADRDALFPIMDASEAAREFGAFAREEQLEALELLVQAAAADRRYAAEERNYLRAIAKAIGVSEEEVDRRVASRIQS